MEGDGTQAEVTAIAAYALAWGMLLQLGAKGLLSAQDTVDAIDRGLTMFEQPDIFAGREAAKDQARQALEKLMSLFPAERS